MEAITSIAGVAMGLTAAISQAGLDSKYKPVMSIAIGVLYALIIMGLSTTSVAVGIIGGLTASGLWSGAKAMTNKEDDYTVEQL